MSNYYFNSSSSEINIIKEKNLKNKEKNIKITNNKGIIKEKDYIKNKTIEKKFSLDEIKDIIQNKHPNWYLSDKNVYKALEIINKKKLKK